MVPPRSADRALVVQARMVGRLTASAAGGVFPLAVLRTGWVERSRLRDRVRELDI